MCLLGAAACFSIAFFIHLPFFALRPSKFAVSIRCVSISPFRHSQLIHRTQSRELAGYARVSSTSQRSLSISSRCSRFVILIGPVNQFKHCELTRIILFKVSCSSSVLKRAPPFLGCLPFLSWTHALLLSWRRSFSLNKDTSLI